MRVSDVARRAIRVGCVIGVSDPELCAAAMQQRDAVGESLLLIPRERWADKDSSASAAALDRRESVV